MKTQSDRRDEAFKFLCGVPLFSNLDEKGTILFLQSDPSEFVYIVRRGDVSISP
jgi:CRP-like cAMP-binding protein